MNSALAAGQLQVHSRAMRMLSPSGDAVASQFGVVLIKPCCLASAFGWTMDYLTSGGAPRLLPHQTKAIAAAAAAVMMANVVPR